MENKLRRNERKLCIKESPKIVSRGETVCGTKFECELTIKVMLLNKLTTTRNFKMISARPR
jgi:hypothetical protein